jgi:hypothetical protein
VRWRLLPSGGERDPPCPATNASAALACSTPGCPPRLLAYPSAPAPHNPKHEQALAFEAFRDVVRFAARGLRDAEGIRLANDEHVERRAHLQAALQAVNQAAFGVKPPVGGGGPSGAPAGMGQYSAVGFSYGGPGGGGSGSSDEEGSGGDDSDDSDGEGAPATEAEAAQEAEDDRVDDIASAFGLADFSYRLHRALEKEGDDEARKRPRPRCARLAGARGGRSAPGSRGEGRGRGRRAMETANRGGWHKMCRAPPNGLPRISFAAPPLSASNA